MTVELYKDQIAKGELCSENDEEYYNSYEVKQGLCKSSVNPPQSK